MLSLPKAVVFIRVLHAFLSFTKLPELENSDVLLPRQINYESIIAVHGVAVLPTS